MEKEMEDYKGTIGVIGGLGPMATACFMEIVTQMTEVKKDQDHLKMIIYSVPQIPDRTSFILGESPEDPLPMMLETAKLLDSQGVSVIAVPCVTGYYFRDRIQSEVKAPVVHGLESLSKLILSRGIKKAGIMATSGSVRSGIIASVLGKYGIEAVIPDEEDQEKVMSLIYDDVKVGKRPDLQKLYEVKDHLEEKGAECIILGCTELSVINAKYDLKGNFFDILEVIKRYHQLPSDCFDILEVLAQRSIEICGGKVRESWKAEN